MTQQTFTGVRLAVPTALGIVATGWPFARVSIGDEGVELIARFPERSEWYAPLDDITVVKADRHRALIARADGSLAYFRFLSWNRDAIVAALVGCDVLVEHVDEVAW